MIKLEKDNFIKFSLSDFLNKIGEDAFKELVFDFFAFIIKILNIF